MLDSFFGPLGPSIHRKFGSVGGRTLRLPISSSDQTHDYIGRFDRASRAALDEFDSVQSFAQRGILIYSTMTNKTWEEFELDVANKVMFRLIANEHIRRLTTPTGLGAQIRQRQLGVVDQVLIKPIWKHYHDQPTVAAYTNHTLYAVNLIEAYDTAGCRDDIAKQELIVSCSAAEQR